MASNPQSTPVKSTESRPLEAEVARRRTFAIISHPDAGKTTLTEKLLLYTGAVELAGAVRARKNQRHATSDWMSMEQQRGISVTATALEMEYDGYHINLLDTPGHQDFSEDTYRTLTAVDSAVMVLDSARGIEPQTLKLFQVCRMRGIPILTFINKMDHFGKDPMALLDEIERVLEISAVPLNWPIGEGQWFQGVYDLRANRVLRFEHTAGGNQSRVAVRVSGLDDPELNKLIGEEPTATLREQVELLSGAGGSFDMDRFLKGEVTPVFFGSALNNFGVEPFLEALVELAPSPRPRASNGAPVDPREARFTGFIFKIQANMDPKHRDRMAFLRVCSGRFEREMSADNPRLGRPVRLNRAFRIFGRDREPIDEAYAGDVIGLISPGLFALGDTLTTVDGVSFEPVPRFAPEHFATILNTDFSKYKQFNSGLEQLEEEGAVQVFHAADGAKREAILAGAGPLQFDVVMSRLRDEYNVEAHLESLPHTMARWVGAGTEPASLSLTRSGTRRVLDRFEKPVLLFGSKWDLDYAVRENEGLALLETA